MLAGSGLNAWHLGDPVPTIGQRILIGIAAWSVYDLRLLDALKQACTGRLGTLARIDILDIDAASRASGGWDYLGRIFPGIGNIYHTSVVGIWENDTLIQTASGATGRGLIIDRYSLSRDEIVQKEPR